MAYKFSRRPDVMILRFLREEVVHFQRFGESLRIVQEYLDNQKVFPVVKTPDMISPTKNSVNLVLR